MRTRTFYLTDENGDILTDENGNELIAQFDITDYVMSAYESRLLLHGYKTPGAYNTAVMLFLLVDENGNQLTDESDEYLAARIQVTTNMLHADATRTMTHGG